MSILHNILGKNDQRVHSETVKETFKLEKRELILTGPLLHAHSKFQGAAFTKTLPISVLISSFLNMKLKTQDFKRLPFRLRI